MGLRQTRIQFQIVLRHMMRREASVEFRADSVAVERTDFGHSLDGLLLVLHDESGHAMLQNLRNRTIVECNHRSAAGHGLDHHQSKWLTPRNREDQGSGIAEK